jgi:hypothetical protein
VYEMFIAIALWCGDSGNYQHSAKECRVKLQKCIEAKSAPLKPKPKSKKLSTDPIELILTNRDDHDDLVEYQAKEYERIQNCFKP